MFRLGIVVIAAATLTGCIDSRLRCGEATFSGECVSVLSVVPTENTIATPDVDVVQGKCADPNDSTKTISEPYYGHSALITLANQGLTPEDPPELAPALVLEEYTVDFVANEPCAQCPALTSLHGLQSLTLLGGQQASLTYPMVPLSTKAEFVAKGGRANDAPSYSAVYTLSGKDPVNKVDLKASATFTLANFDNCQK